MSLSCSVFNYDVIDIDAICVAPCMSVSVFTIYPKFAPESHRSSRISNYGESATFSACKLSIGMVIEYAGHQN